MLVMRKMKLKAARQRDRVKKMFSVKKLNGSGSAD